MIVQRQTMSLLSSGCQHFGCTARATESLRLVGVRQILWQCVVLEVMCGLSAGCRSGQEAPYAPVAGRVTYRGKPLDHGRISLIHESGLSGTGEIQADGSFSFDAPVGDNMVVIERRDTSAAPTDPKAIRGYRPPSLIPERYSDSLLSGLQWTVADGDNRKDWDLKD